MTTQGTLTPMTRGMQLALPIEGRASRPRGARRFSRPRDCPICGGVLVRAERRLACVGCGLGVSRTRR